MLAVVLPLCTQHLNQSYPSITSRPTASLLCKCPHLVGHPYLAGTDLLAMAPVHVEPSLIARAVAYIGSIAGAVAALLMLAAELSVASALFIFGFIAAIPILCAEAALKCLYTVRQSPACLVGVLVLLAALVVFALVIFKPPRSAQWTPVASELHDSLGHGLPSLAESASVSLSVVIPAFNEEQRITNMLSETLAYLESRRDPFEVLVVDDGSSDSTVDIVTHIASSFKSDAGSLRLVKLSKNRGKGAAVKHGVLHSRGASILFADADGATDIRGLARLDEALHAKLVTKDGRSSYGIAVGSRAHLVHTDAVVKRSAARNFLMRGFHMYLYVMGIRTVADTQCGFKIFTRDAARRIFPYLRCASWIFDCELLLLAGYMNIPVVEVPVDWHEVPGSKVSILSDSIAMARDLFVLRFNYCTRRWRTDAV